MREPTFERCPHDRQNPYKMISQDVIFDNTIGPIPRMLIIHLLSLPPNWKIYHSQLRKSFGVGEVALNSAINSLIKAGYVERTREKLKGVFQPYKYIIREFKKCSPNEETQPGSPLLDNQDLISIDIGNKKEEQQQRSSTAAAKPPVVASLAKKENGSKGKQPQPLKIYDCLEPLSNVSLLVKRELTRKYPEHQVKDAVEWFIHEKSYAKGPDAAIRAACRDEYKGASTSPFDKKIEAKTKANWKALARELAQDTVMLRWLDIRQDEDGIQFGDNDKIYFREGGFMAKVENSLRRKNAFTPRLANFFTMWG